MKADKILRSEEWLCHRCSTALGFKPINEVNGAVRRECANCGDFGWCRPRGDFVLSEPSPTLHLANDRKTRAYPAQDNTFGLPAGPLDKGGSCPWCTRGKGGCFHIPEGRKSPTCYAWNIMQAFRGAGANLRANMDAIAKESMGGPERIASKLCGMIAAFAMKTENYARIKKIDPKPLMKFRIHWAGDMYSADYAKAWAETCRRFPGVSFWTYTRSYRLAKHLVGIPNLKLYLSLDEDSWERGMREFFKLGGNGDPRLGVAIMAKSEDFIDKCMEKMEKFPDRYGPRDEVSAFTRTVPLSRCPVDLGKMPLTGACCKCRMCISPGAQLLWFKC